MKLSIGYPVFRDFDGLYFSACDIPLTHPEIIDDVEIIALDNDPDSPSGKATKNWVEGWLANNLRARYVAELDAHGPAHAKNRCVEEATGDAVIVMDSHVRVARGKLQRLINFYDNEYNQGLYSGPMVYDNNLVQVGNGKPLTSHASHMDEVWRGENLGGWGSRPRAAGVWG